jgi:alkylhydroperoxidase family enzyme
LTRSEREMIATLGSTRNNCFLCQTSHRATAAHHLDCNYQLVDAVRFGHETAPIADKLRALLSIAGTVQRGGKDVGSEDIDQSRRGSSADLEICDKAFIAALCMYNSLRGRP